MWRFSINGISITSHSRCTRVFSFPTEFIMNFIRMKSFSWFSVFRFILNVLYIYTSLYRWNDKVEDLFEQVNLSRLKQRRNRLAKINNSDVSSLEIIEIIITMFFFLFYFLTKFNIMSTQWILIVNMLVISGRIKKSGGRRILEHYTW